MTIYSGFGRLLFLVLLAGGSVIFVVTAVRLAVRGSKSGGRNLADELRKIAEAPNGIAAIHAMVSLQARGNPVIWGAARAIDAVRRLDRAAERSWQDRLRHRLEGCREMVARLEQDGTLRAGLDPEKAADLLWTLTSLRTWEDLVLERGWSAAEYEQRVNELLLAALCDGE